MCNQNELQSKDEALSRTIFIESSPGYKELVQIISDYKIYIETINEYKIVLNDHTKLESVAKILQ